jgi:hypothetical protein
MMGNNEGDHSLFERIAVLETKVKSLEEQSKPREKDVATGLDKKFGEIPLKTWLWVIGILTALGQGPDLVKILETAGKLGVLK